MSKSSEISRFEDRFTDNIIEVVAVTGALGIGAGRANGNIMWKASIDLVAYKNLCTYEPVIKEESRLEWLVDDEELQKSSDILKENTVVRLQVRRAEKSMMLVRILETGYRDNDLEVILQELMKPVFFNDELLGKFELDKSVKLFERKIPWAGAEGILYFDWNENENIMRSALETAHALFKDQDKWNMKIRMYASEELLELANEWLQDDEEAEIDEITKEMFIDFMELKSVSVYPEGNFEIFFFDGNMFLGHSIIVNGKINGDLTSAKIAG